MWRRPLTGWQPFDEWRKHVPDPDQGSMEITPKPISYAGVRFRSTLEADWAATLDHYGIAWEYEPGQVILSSGKRYVPDFMLPALRTIIEVKGGHMDRLEKAADYARGVLSQAWIVLVGFTPARHSLTPYKWERYLQWNDAAGYDTRLARCQACGTWQWLRPLISVSCRTCRNGTKCTGLLATSGEMPFKTAQPEGILAALARMESP